MPENELLATNASRISDVSGSTSAGVFTGTGPVVELQGISAAIPARVSLPFDAVALAVGDSLTVSYDARFVSAIANTTDRRLVTSLGESASGQAYVATQKVAGLTSTTFVSGFAETTSLNLWGSALDNTTALPNTGTAPTTSDQLWQGTSTTSATDIYRVTVRITRTSAGEVQLEQIGQTGVGAGQTLSVTRTTTSVDASAPLVRFDNVHVHMLGSYSNWQLANMQVTHTPAAASATNVYRMNAAVAATPLASSIEPAAPFDLRISSGDSGSSSTDNITNNTSFTISGVTAAGARLWVFNDANGDGRIQETELLATNVLANASTGAFSQSLTLGAGEHNIRVVAVDSEGHLGRVSQALNITVDLQATDAPRPMGLVTEGVINSDTGMSSADGITNNPFPTFRFRLPINEALRPAENSPAAPGAAKSA